MAGTWQMGRVTSPGVWEMGEGSAFAGSLSISTVSGDNVLRVGETSVAVVGTGLNTVTSAIIETSDGSYQEDVTASYSASDVNNATFNHSLGDVPLSTNSYSLRLALSDGVGTAYRLITVLPASGEQVVELAGTLILTDPESAFAPYTGPAPVVGEQFVTPLLSVEGGTIFINADTTFTIDYSGLPSVPATDSFAISWWSDNGTTGKVWSTGTVNVSEPAATVQSVTVPADGTYGPGDALTLTVNWAAIVTVSGTPRIELTLGTETVYANYVSGSGTNALIFQAVVPATSNATGSLTVGTLELNGGTILDDESAPATLTLNNVASTAGIVVDTTGPNIVSVTVPPAGTYVEGNILNFTVNWAEAIEVTGVPRLSLSIGGITQYANYASKPGAAALRFSYTIQATDFDNNGILILGLERNGGTIKDLLGNNASTVLAGVGSTSGILIDASGPIVVGVTPPAVATYGPGDALTFLLEWDQLVDVTGTPRLPVVIDGTTVYADYVSGTGTSVLTFTHTIATTGLQESVGIQLSDLELNGGTLEDASNSPAILIVSDTGPFAGVLVDTVSPTGTLTQTGANVAQPALSGTVDDPNATVTVSPGAVQALNNGDGTWNLDAGNISALNEGNNTITVVFEDPHGNSSQIQQILVIDTTVPVVVLNDVTTDEASPTLTGTCDDPTALIELTINSVTYSTSNITAGSWSIPVTATLAEGVYPVTVTATDPAGNVGQDTATVTIEDNVVPAVQSVTFPVAGVYSDGETLSLIVNYQKAVVVTGAPFIPVSLGANTRNFVYASGTGTNSLTFSYTLVVGDNDDDGLGVGDINLNGGSMQDASSNAASLVLGNPANSGIIIDTEAAVLTINDVNTINTAPIASGTCNEATASLTLVVNGVSYFPIVNPNTNAWAQQLETLTPGQYTMTLNATDVAGNASTEVTGTLTINSDQVVVPDPNEPDRLSNALDLVKRRLGRFTANPTQLDDFIFDELKATQDRLEGWPSLPWFCKVRASVFTTVAGDDYLLLPSTFLRLRDEWEKPVQVYHEGQWKSLDVLSYEQLWERTNGTGVPQAAAHDGVKLALGPTPNAAYQMKLGYYTRQPILEVGVVTSNAWLKHAFDLMCAETGLILANNYLKNQEAVALFDAWARRARQALEQTNVAHEVAAMESWELNHGR